jgi:phosphopantetheinyl transferase
MGDAAYTPIDEWRLTSGDDELSADEAHVWRAALDQPANVVSKLAPLLSPDEYQRAIRYYRPADRDRYVVGRGMSRVAPPTCKRPYQLQNKDHHYES